MAWSVEPASSAISPLRAEPLAIGVAARRSSRRAGGLLQVLGGTAADLVDQQGRPREPPGGPLSPSILRISSTRSAASAWSPAARARSKSPSRTPRFSGWRVASSRQYCRAQVQVAEPDLGRSEPIEERGPVGGGDLLASRRQLRHRGPGRVAPLQAPVVQAGQLDVQARAQVLLGLVEDLQGRRRPCPALGQPGQREPIPEVARLLGQGRGQERPGVVQAVLGGEQVEAEQDERLDGLGSAFSASRSCRSTSGQFRWSRGWRTRLLEQEPHEIEPPLGLARRHRQEDRDRLVELARPGQGPGELDAGRFRTPIALGGPPQGIQPLLVGTQAAVAFGQHEVELDGELGVGSQDRPGRLDPGDRLGPFLPLEQDLGFQEPDEGVAEPGGPRAVDVVAGLVLPVDLVLEDQVLGQLEGQDDGGIGLERLPQDGLGPIEVSFPGLQAGQAQGEGEVLGIELEALLEVGPRRGGVRFLLAGDGRGEQHFGIVGGQLQGFLDDVASCVGGRRQELVGRTASGRRKPGPTWGSWRPSPGSCRRRPRFRRSSVRRSRASRS